MPGPDSLLCYKAKLARSEVPQDGCAPATPRDRGTRISPRPARHAGVSGVVVDHQLGRTTADSVKEQEVCLLASVACPSCSAADPDGDGVPTHKDICPDVADPAQEDLDRDGFGDACDLDADGDGLTDSKEAERGLDPRLRDTDGDGARDGFDPHPTDAKRTTDPDAVLLQSGAVVPPIGLDPQVVVSGATTAVVQLRHPLTRNTRQELLESYGLSLDDYLPNRAYIARIDPLRVAAAAGDPRVRAVVTITPDDRVDRDVRHHRLPASMRSEDGLMPFSVQFVSETPATVAQQILENAGAFSFKPGAATTSFTAELNAAGVDALSRSPEVLFVEWTGLPGASEDVASRVALNIDIPDPATLTINSLPETGVGIAVGMLEAHAGSVGSIWGYHPELSNGDFAGVAISTMPDTPLDQSTHATRVASMIIGQGACNANPDPNLSLGTAPGASLISGPLVLLETDVTVRYEALANAGASIVNNSWGNLATAAGYGAIDEMLDKVVQGDFLGIEPRPLVIHSAGNTRTEFCGGSTNVHCQTMVDLDGDSVDDDGFHCISRPANAKNVLTVGAVNGAQTQTCFSANGPTLDGRIKPELVAAGTGLTEAADFGDGPCITSGIAGTSYAAPSVAGLSALLHEAWIDRGIEGIASGSLPLPSTIRALLVHTAQDLDNPGTSGIVSPPDGPSFRTGWGIPNAAAAIAVLDSHSNENRIFESANLDETGDVEIFTFTTQPADIGLQFDITLAWDDYFAGRFTDGNLVNDLDLEVEAPNGFIYHPWTLDFDETNPDASGVCQVDTAASACPPNNNAFGGICQDSSCLSSAPQDRVNNLERVLIPTVRADQVGIWTVRIIAAAMNEPSVDGGFDQRFSLILPPDNDVDCGQELSGDAFLFEDLDCSDSSSGVSLWGPSIVTDQTTLDCQGFSIIGNGSIGIGVRAYGVADARVQDCRIFQFFEGIRATPTSAAPLLHFQALRNVLGQNWFGMVLQDSNQGVAEDNEILGNSILGLVVSGSGNQIRNNEFHGNLEGIEIGGGAVTSDLNLLRENLIHDGHQTGIRITSATSTMLTQNTVCHSISNGLELWPASADSFVGPNNILCQSGNYDVWIHPTEGDIDAIRDPASNQNFCDSVNYTATGTFYTDMGIPMGCRSSCQPPLCEGQVDLGGDFVALPGSDPRIGSPDTSTFDIDELQPPPGLVDLFRIGIILWDLPNPRPIGKKIRPGDLEGIDSKSLRLHRRDEKSGTFHAVAGSGLTPAGNLVIGWIDEPGTYAVFGSRTTSGSRNQREGG